MFCLQLVTKTNIDDIKNMKSILEMFFFFLVLTDSVVRCTVVASPLPPIIDRDFINMHYVKMLRYCISIFPIKYSYHNQQYYMLQKQYFVAAQEGMSILSTIEKKP